MQYIDEFIPASEDDEVSYILSNNKKMTMTCYSENVYPFGIFTYKGLDRIQFGTVTVFCGGNGSGKSTLLNIIAEKLRVGRSAPFNQTPFFSEYLKFCRARLTFGREVPRESKIITSDDVFDFLLHLRSVNEGIDSRRDELFNDYWQIRNEPQLHMKSLDDSDAIKLGLEVKHKSISKFVNKRLPENLNGKSNGESAYLFFTNEIKDNALYLLDEPENSLSPSLQLRLSSFITDSVRFYNCQFIISTHSPFVQSIKGAKIYDLDSEPICVRKWTELENVKIYRDFFENHRNDFQD